MSPYPVSPGIIVDAIGTDDPLPNHPELVSLVLAMHFNTLSPTRRDELGRTQRLLVSAVSKRLPPCIPQYVVKCTGLGPKRKLRLLRVGIHSREPHHASFQTLATAGLRRGDKG